MRKFTALVSATTLATALVVAPSISFADTSATPTPSASKAHPVDPAKAAYRAALAQYKLAVQARKAAREIANSALSVALAAAKSPVEKRAARAAHKAAIANLPVLPAKPSKPTK